MTANPLRASRGTTTTLNTRVLKEGELAYNTTTKQLHVGDGATVGGVPVVGGASLDRFDAVGDGVTDDTASIQAAHDYVLNTFGAGIVDVGPYTYLTGQITQHSAILFVGQGRNASCFKAKAGLNGPILKSYNFDALTGQNKWLVSDGMIYGIGFVDMRLDGNRANQTIAAPTVQYYAKGLIIDGLIVDSLGAGIYTEGSDVAGQIDYKDLPEGDIALGIRNCGSYGWHNRGPHDANVRGLFINACGDDCLRIERSPGVYSGSPDIDFAHIYAGTKRGVYVNANAQARFGRLISESNHEEAIVCDGWYNQFGKLQAYNNCRTSGDYQARITGSKNTVMDFQSKDNGADTGGLQITGTYNEIEGGMISGEGSGGTGLDLNSEHNKIKARIEGFSGSGGSAMRTGNTSAVKRSRVEVTLCDSATLWSNGASGEGNFYDIRGEAETGQTVISGVTAPTASEHWIVTIYDAAISGYRHYSGGRYESRAAAVGPVVLTNSADGANVQVAAFEGDRPNPATDDIAYLSYLLSDAVGTQTEFVRCSWRATDITNGTEDGQMFWSVMINGALTTALRLNGIALFPASSGLLTLGLISNPYGNCFSNGYYTLGDGVTAPGATSGFAKLYVDAADGDLKIIFGDGTIKTISVDT